MILKNINIGDKVIKNTENWIKNDFDGWGRGVGVGEVVIPPYGLTDDEIDVKWPNGRCFETIDQVIKIENSSVYYLKNTNKNLSFIIGEFGHSAFYSQYDQFIEVNISCKLWKTISFLNLTQSAIKCVTANTIRTLLRQYKIINLNKK